MPNEHLGKLPPQAIDLEKAVLGALMLEKDALESVADILKQDIFYDSRHQVIYKAIQSLVSTNQPVDILTVTAQLRFQGELEMIGGAYYITELTDRVASAANIEFHSRIVLQKFIQREMIRLSSQVVTQCYEDTSDVFTVITQSDIEKDRLLTKLVSRKEVSNAELLTESIEKLEQAGLSHDHITGVPSGFAELDKITGGWQKTDLIILAARPGMGKTSLALQAGCNAAIRNNAPVAIFSLEMSSLQLMHKQISIETGVPLWKFKKNGLDSEDWSQINYYKPTLHNAPIHWDDTPALNIIEFRAKCRRMKRKYGIKLIIVDYLQLLQGDDQKKPGNREQEIGFISRQLKATAKELDVPVIALSQLSRAVESRPNKRPMLSDLRESGSIEQDADMVMFLYRDEYYHIEYDANNNSTAGVAELTIAKNRHGATDEIVLKFDSNTTGFRDDAFPEISSDNPFAGLSPSSSFNKPSNFIIRPAMMDDDDLEPPF